MQWDTRAAETLAAHADLTLVALPATLKAQIREADLPRLRASGPLGELLAKQSVAHGHTYKMGELGRTHSALPDDLLNFQYDPVAAAVAVGWGRATIEERRIRTVVEGDILRFVSDDQGRLIRVVTDVDGVTFGETWISAVEAAQR